MMMTKEINRRPRGGYFRTNKDPVLMSRVFVCQIIGRRQTKKPPLRGASLFVSGLPKPETAFRPWPTSHRFDCSTLSHKMLLLFCGSHSSMKGGEAVVDDLLISFILAVLAGMLANPLTKYLF